ncbi:hypothetical protein HMPREF9123_2799 [Neisseria bacilliformis ATCC BAA-1200]|uniref:Uncharacterized protein n=1 Tax=Neisseria bacilliformis ATCC BAA-1200 TaxID=888742 RepID=F2BGE2_9NEIS|nr:hypothetical protein HMPREF9123_2799 [Neisseria bacilliformis ATCC BAA-1200]
MRRGGSVFEFFEQAAEEVLQFGVVGVGETGPDAVAFGGDEGLDFADEGFAFGGEAQEDLAAVAVVAAAFAPYPAARGHFVGQAGGAGAGEVEQVAQVGGHDFAVGADVDEEEGVPQAFGDAFGFEAAVHVGAEAFGGYAQQLGGEGAGKVEFGQAAGEEGEAFAQFGVGKTHVGSGSLMDFSGGFCGKSVSLGGKS